MALRPPPPVHPSESEGSRLLAKHVAGLDLCLKTFCAQKGLPSYQVMRLMNGKTADVTLHLAQLIERATGGGVPMPTWLRRPRRSG